MSRQVPGFLVLGSWVFCDPAYWGKTDTSSARKTIRCALEKGLLSFDTAYSYGKGRSEQLLGQQLRALGARFPRGSYTISTKIHTYDPKQVRKKVIDSLKRLQTEYVDTIYLHWPHESAPMEELYHSLWEVTEEGLARGVGVSNPTADLLSNLAATVPISACQFSYSLLYRAAERYLIPICREQGIETYGYSPLGQGSLTRSGVFDPADARSRLIFFDQAYKEVTCRIQTAVQQVALENTSSQAQVALAWIRQRGQVDHAVVGSRSVTQLEELLQSLDSKLTDAQLESLEVVSSGVDHRMIDIFGHTT